MPYEHNKSVAEIAAHFGVSTKTIYRMCQRREIPHIKIRGAKRFSLPECEEYFAQRNRVAVKKAA